MVNKQPYVVQIDPIFEKEIKQKIKVIKKESGMSIRRICSELIIAGIKDYESKKKLI